MADGFEAAAAADEGAATAGGDERGGRQALAELLPDLDRPGLDAFDEDGVPVVAGIECACVVGGGVLGG